MYMYFEITLFFLFIYFVPVYYIIQISAHMFFLQLVHRFFFQFFFFRLLLSQRPLAITIKKKENLKQNQQKNKSETRSIDLCVLFHVFAQSWLLVFAFFYDYLFLSFFQLLKYQSLIIFECNGKISTSISSSSSWYFFFCIKEFFLQNW